MDTFLLLISTGDAWPIPAWEVGKTLHALSLQHKKNDSDLYIAVLTDW